VVPRVGLGVVPVGLFVATHGPQGQAALQNGSLSPPRKSYGLPSGLHPHRSLQRVGLNATSGHKVVTDGFVVVAVGVAVVTQGPHGQADLQNWSLSSLCKP
jgi:hypothetical protein